ncbi:DNA-binding SARP family transcriptional activator [Kribbella sp. VKM Ac-2569]|uniref:AfsR/SARP family transcriptional regulator n=1 Tax=Kribbella sp. VKM Ac-2569 TaxID=2512220 RepID=UPI00102BBF61|nr:BTAD domain-containing putative transcriptional regulator [Kribbella sp. VKM Ac-2569]RZT27639.1 DNA-binding SARP family transcriptional activator [Kribbella sp. VKM Ac-2569]
MYLPPVLRPLAAQGVISPAVQRIAEAPFSVVRGVPGSYAAERLAGVIDSWQRWNDCVWLRAQDIRPTELAQSLAAACGHRWLPTEPQPGTRPLPALRLGEMIYGAPEGAVIVLELGRRVTPGLTRLVKAIRLAITERGVRMVVVSESRLHPPVARGPDCVVSASDLADNTALDGYSSAPDRARLLRFTGRHAAVLDDVLAAARLWSPDAVDEALNSSYGVPSLLGCLTTALLDRLTPEQRSALQVAVAVGYWHPQMGTGPVTSEQLRPWLVPMEQQWGWLRPIWASSLRRELTRPRPTRQHWFGGGRAALREVPRLPTVQAAPRQGRLQAQLLGSLEVQVNGAPVASWNGQRGTSVLRYLLYRKQHACARDELLEEFWHDAPAAAARNRLQVAVSGLRRAFLGVTALNVVEYADGGYRINPKLLVEVDVETFERGLSAAAASERADIQEDARTAYRHAIAIYRGDFAADAPFEQWTLLPRESLRIKLVDALDRLSRIELTDHRTDDCIATAHRMLDIDPCREDAHRLLMRCYAEQGRTYQALRQYEFCARILQARIDASPAPDTIRLYDAIRNSSA